MTVNLLMTPEKLSWAQFREVDKSADGKSMAQTASLMQPGTIRTGKSGKDLAITQLQINDALSNRYDRETKGGADTAAQQRWETQVASWEQHKKAS